MELLFIEDLVFESAFHDVFSYFFNALNKEPFQLVLLGDFLYLFKVQLLIFTLFFAKVVFQQSDCVIIIGFHCLNILGDFILNIVLLHSGFEDQLDELIEFSVFGWDVAITRCWAIGLWSLSLFNG